MCRLLVGCAQAACRLRVKKTRYRLVGRVAKCPQLRANYVNHQPLRPLVGYHILLMLSFQVRATSGKTMAEKLLINRQQKFANPINALTSLIFLGSCQFIITLTFLGSIYTPSIEIISPRYRTSVLQNLHLSISNYRPALRRASRTSLIYFQYLVRLLLYIRMSLI